MKNGVIQRIREMLDRYELSVSSLAKKIGVVQATLNRQLTGENALSLETVNAILYCYKEISAEWLLRGEGSMIKGEGTDNGSVSKSFDANIEIDNDGYLKIRIKG